MVIADTSISVSTPATSTLLADIGGTQARFAIMSGDVIGRHTHVPTRDHATPEAAIRAFLAASPGTPRPARAVIAAAGPLVGRRIKMTNAAWTLDPVRIAEALDFDSVDLLNDFAAQAWAIPALDRDDLRQIGGGEAAVEGHQAILGAGTGFGLALRATHGAGEFVIVTEGGHATLAAESEAEEAVLHGLRRLHGHVSIERVLSGPGLAALYLQLAAARGAPVARREAADIVACALSGSCPASIAALEMFCGWFGSVAGDVALTTGALGGVYLAGGVAMHFPDFLATSTFRTRFEAKGRMAAYMRAIPVWVVTHSDPAFLGLARYAAR